MKLAQAIEKTKNQQPISQSKTKKKVLPYLMVAPSMLVFILFSFIPIIYMVYLSFHDWNFISPDMNFVGLKNFQFLSTDPRFLQTMRNTFLYTVLTVLGFVILGILMALALNKNTKVHSFMQSTIFAPHIISLVSISMLWLWLMDYDYGLFNYILGKFGINPVRWLTDPNVVMYSLAAVSVWKGVGYYCLIFLSGLQAIPNDIYEAAALDNTPWHRKLFKITIPMLSPTIFFVGITSIIASFKVFETISIMTQGGPMNSSNTIVYYIYETGFKFFNMGLSSAAGVILFIVIAILTFLYFKLMAKRVYYN